MTVNDQNMYAPESLCYLAWATDTQTRSFLGRLPKVDLIILEGEKCPYVRTSVRPYVRPSTQSFFDLNEIWCGDIGGGDIRKKFSSDLNEIWYVGRGR